ncbi:hypothetical protein ACFPN4_02145 [Ureibacillus thermophilus]|uniref:Uncharacterized protein n=1 Tax=Ureibacillus thermophilus TaxID=367743 RepID=A0A4P6UUE4_9BACL|nr:hypothetical protein [Ureibacillus thermophilus]QBK25508.1 hypothetical protein DKZ56_06365 [Ureibacillus thermophilus]
MNHVNPPRSIKEIVIDGGKYIYKSDERFDYLTEILDNEVKIHLKFTKDKDKRLEAENALKTFFLELLF